MVFLDLSCINPMLGTGIVPAQFAGALGYLRGLRVL